MVKRTKRFFEGDGVSDSDSNSGMKEERARIDAEAAAEKAAEKARTPSADYGDYVPQSSSDTTKATPKPTPKPVPETSSLRRVNRSEAESAISKAAGPSSVRKLSREEGESIKKSSAPAKPDVTKMPVNDRIKKSIEDSVSSARSGSGKTDTRSVNERIRSSIRSTFGFAKGGKVSSASSRGDGIATKGKTRGRLC